MKTFSEFQESVASLALKGGLKLLPKIPSALKAVTAGTLTGLSLLQAKRSQDTKASRGRRSEKPKRKLSRMQQKMIDLENKRGERVTNTDPNKGINRKRETFNNPTNLSKPENEFHTTEFQPDKSMTEDAIPTNNASSGNIAGLPPDDLPVNKKKKKKKGEPTIIARGCMPGARSRFKGGVELLASLKKNKYT